MFKNDNIYIGIVAGVIFPVMFYVILTEVDILLITYWDRLKGTQGFSDELIAILSVCSNLIPITVFNKRKMGLAMRGVMTSTLIFTAILVTVYWDKFLST